MFVVQTITLSWARAKRAEPSTAAWQIEIVESWAAAEVVLARWFEECEQSRTRLAPLQVQVAWENGETYTSQPIYPNSYDGSNLGAWLRYELALLSTPPSPTSTSSGARDWALASVALTAEQRARCRRLSMQCSFDDGARPG